MSHAVSKTIVVTLAGLLATACATASAQDLASPVDHTVMAYYAIPFGGGNRAARDGVLGLKLEQERPGSARDPGRERLPPAADFQVSLRSGTTMLKLHGQDVSGLVRVLREAEEQDPGFGAGVGALVGVAALIAAGMMLFDTARNTKAIATGCWRELRC